VDLPSCSVFIGGGLILISVPHEAYRGALANPEYFGLILVMFGFLLQWPICRTLKQAGDSEPRAVCLD
jgi:hypothetical protein